MTRIKKGERNKKGDFKELVKLPKNFNRKVAETIDDELITRT